MLTIGTSDGVAEAVVATPPGGTGPGVLFFMDAFGLRPRIQEMAEQIASWGYVVLAPNVFYRDGTVSEVAPQGDLTASMEAGWSPMQPTRRTWGWPQRGRSSSSGTRTTTPR